MGNKESRRSSSSCCLSKRARLSNGRHIGDKLARYGSATDIDITSSSVSVSNVTPNDAPHGRDVQYYNFQNSNHTQTRCRGKHGRDSEMCGQCSEYTDALVIDVHQVSEVLEVTETVFDHESFSENSSQQDTVSSCSPVANDVCLKEDDTYMSIPDCFYSNKEVIKHKRIADKLRKQRTKACNSETEIAASSSSPYNNNQACDNHRSSGEWHVTEALFDNDSPCDITVNDLLSQNGLADPITQNVHAAYDAPPRSDDFVYGNIPDVHSEETSPLYAESSKLSKADEHVQPQLIDERVSVLGIQGRNMGTFDTPVCEYNLSPTCEENDNQRISGVFEETNTDLDQYAHGSNTNTNLSSQKMQRDCVDSMQRSDEKENKENKRPTEPLWDTGNSFVNNRAHDKQQPVTAKQKNRKKRENQYYEMIKLIRGLIVDRVIVNEIIPRLPFIDEYDDINQLAAWSPRSAIEKLLQKLLCDQNDGVRNEQVPKCTMFKRALEACGYERIVKAIQGVNLPSDEKQREKIRKCAPTLGGMLGVMDLLPVLLDKGLISDMDAEKIRAMCNNEGLTSAAYHLLRTISKRKTNWYTEFIASLKEVGRTDLAEDLEVPELMSIRVTSPACNDENTDLPDGVERIEKIEKSQELNDTLPLAPANPVAASSGKSRRKLPPPPPPNPPDPHYDIPPIPPPKLATPVVDSESHSAQCNTSVEQDGSFTSAIHTENVPQDLLQEIHNLKEANERLGMESVLRKQQETLLIENNRQLKTVLEQRSRISRLKQENDSCKKAMEHEEFTTKNGMYVDVVYPCAPRPKVTMDFRDVNMTNIPSSRAWQCNWHMTNVEPVMVYDTKRLRTFIANSNTNYYEYPYEDC